MEELTSILAWTQIGTAAATTLATIALVFATFVLAVHTKRMADNTSQPHIVATLEPNQWAPNHFDLRIENTGNATAYQIKLSFDPELPSSISIKKRGMPLEKVSVLRPGQALSSYLCEYEALDGMSFTVTTEWGSSPGAQIEKNRYVLNISDYDHYGTLGSRSPAIQIAEQLKKIREDWKNVASGSKRISVDSHSSEERAAEAAAQRARIEQIKTSSVRASEDIAKQENLISTPPKPKNDSSRSKDK